MTTNTIDTPVTGIFKIVVSNDYVLQPIPPTGKESFMRQVAINGEVLPITRDYQNNWIFDLDTTKLFNGVNKITVGTRVSLANGSNKVLAQQETTITVANNKAPIELRAEFSEYYLVPGASTVVWYYAVYNDGSQGVWGDQEIISFANIGVYTKEFVKNGLKASFKVIVREKHDAPHFAKNGEIITAYDPAKSQYMVAMFGLDSNQLIRNDQPVGVKLRDAVKAAGITTLNIGFYLSNNFSDADWLNGIKYVHNEITKVLTELDLNAHFTFDDACRTATAMYNTLTNPKAASRIQYCLGYAVDTGRAVVVAGLDECNANWGNTPFPTDGRWLKKNPPIPDTAFIRLNEIINAGRHPAFTWPVAGSTNPDVEIAWNLNSQVDEIYWGLTNGYSLYPTTYSSAQLFRDGILRSTDGRLSAHPGNRPRILQIGANGELYRKNGSSDRYDPNADTLLGPGHTTSQIVAQLYYAAFFACGVRIYSFDRTDDKKNRERPADSSERASGTDPWTTLEKWQAMSLACNNLNKYKEFIFQPAAHTPNFGKNFLVGRKLGIAGELLILVNISSVPQRVNIPVKSKSTWISQLGTATDTTEVTKDLDTFIYPDEVLFLMTPAVQVDPCETKLAAITLERDKLKSDLVDLNAKLDEISTAFEAFSVEQNKHNEKIASILRPLNRMRDI
jgi:hypothetical protein